MSEGSAYFALMPAATYPDIITQVHWSGTETREEASAFHLLEKFTEIDPALLQGSQMVDALLNLIRASSARVMTYELTMQPYDYFGYKRPYDCEPMTEFWAACAEIPDMPAAWFQVLPVDELQSYKTQLCRLLLETKLFADERSGIADALEWLAACQDGRVLLICRQGG